MTKDNIVISGTLCEKNNCVIKGQTSQKTWAWHPLTRFSSESRMKLFPERKENADVCQRVSAKCCLMCLNVICVPPSPLSPHSSLCLLLLVRSRAGPTSASARPDVLTDPADSPDTGGGGEKIPGTRREGENSRTFAERKAAGRIAASHTVSRL